LARIKLSKIQESRLPRLRGCGKGKGRAEGQVPFARPFVFFGARGSPVRLGGGAIVGGTA
jgi:hypothetical protein